MNPAAFFSLGLCIFIPSICFGQKTTLGVPLRGALIKKPASALQEKALPPGAVLPGRVPAGVAPAGSQAAAARPVKPGDDKLTRILALQFNRSPGSILKTWSLVNNPVVEKELPQPPGPDSDDKKKLAARQLAESVRKFEQDIILGNWKGAAAFLNTFPKKENAKRVFDHLLTRLQARPVIAGPTALPANLPANLPAEVVVAPPTGVMPDDHLIAPEDIVGLIGLAPEKLSKQNVTSIGLLTSKSIGQGFDITLLIEKFESGLSNIGGVDRKARLNAARIFLSAGKPGLAQDFLPGSGADGKKEDVEYLVLASNIAQRRYSLERKPGLLEKAWSANQQVLATAGISAAQRQTAFQYAVELAPKVSEEIGQVWLEKSFTSDASRGIQILAGIGQATAEGQTRNRSNPTARLEALKLQQTAVATLLKSAPQKAAAWHRTLDLLALNWLKEAKTTRLYARSTGRPQFQRDRYGNIYYANPNQTMRMPASSSSRPRPIPVQDILDTRPQTEWFAVLNGELKAEFEEMLARLYLKNAEEAKAFPFIESIAGRDRKRAKGLVDEFLKVWTRNHNPNENRGNRNQYIYFFGFEQRANSIPLTRSKQQRNLKELRGWVSRLRKMGLEEVDEQALVRAFTTCHSTAEVYRVEDIEEVFGSIQKLKANTVAGLVQKMRTNLSTAWRQPRVQEAKKTNRKEPEIQKEVQRGYLVAEKITKEALFEHPDSWELQLARACIQFDKNAYQQELKKSSEFTEKQRAVFADFAAAAKTYAGQVPNLEEDEQSTEVYDLWFYASLGACDLALLTHEKLSMATQFPEIRDAIGALPGEAPNKHMSQFANKLFTRMSPLKPEMKYRYLKGGFEIVGDHPDAAEAQKVFQYYNDLVSEVRLQTRIDGSDVVGEQPFGMFVNLYHTEEVERESGGFGKYLQNQNSMTYAYNYGRPTNDYRDAFETAAIAALSEHFEVISVTFEDEKNIESREANEPGWRVTPYAYILMKARGREVDVIPPVKLDLDFLDTSGYAVLPIESKAIPVDTMNREPDARPMTDLEIVQTLDERRSGEGKLVLEVKATARGLIPEFGKLLKLEDDAFEVIEEQDQGVSVSAFDPESNDIRMVTEREWLIELRAGEEAGLPKDFDFCSALAPETGMVFKRYEDADLVEVEPSVSLENRYGQARRAWIYWLLGGIPVLTLVTVVGVLVARVPRPEKVARYRRPEEITPLSVISLLKEIRGDEKLGGDKQARLDEVIERIEQHFFYTEEGEAPDLKKETDHWLAIAN
ncbi:MAG: hypothetical protein VX768_18870 [Planctomycetota bacterium]|nr:hypothetical protein [Planctomycetota bacterium]